MARRTSAPRRTEPSPEPEPLPPERRTVGQLVAETIRIYGKRFWPSLALGVPVASLNAVAAGGGMERTLVVVTAAGAVVVTASYVAACALVTGLPLLSRPALVAYVVGVIVFLPFPFLAVVYVLPGLAWFALLGLSVPAALAEGLPVGRALRRGLELARADFVHVLGGLATLVIAVVVVQGLLAFLLREYADNTERVAAVLASLVLSPLLFLGSALLYVDQRARHEVRAGTR